jgi:queuine tRNA-ribosyltransferase
MPKRITLLPILFVTVPVHHKFGIIVKLFLMQITTPHGDLKTPVFMPVGTAATVKSLDPLDLKNLGVQIVLANNYHLFLRPGSKSVKKMGGIHQFMGWDRPILTDSGGFQVQSLSRDEIAMCQIDDDGVTFRSHLDGGTLHRFTPEIATRSQIDLEADIIMAFDDSVPAGADRKRVELAVKRTNNWLLKCIKTWRRYTSPLQFPSPKLGEGSGVRYPQLFGIIQGGEFPDLLRESAKFIIDQDLPGIAIGGAVIGSDPAQTAQTIATVRDQLPKNKPLYAMGVGVKPSDLISVFKAGADMCDCVAPTRLARTGYLYHPESKNERIDISQTQFRLSRSVINSQCDCYTCRSGFTLAYLHHLLKAKELLYYRLASIHNLRTMIRTVEKYKP